jgi:uncharacterized repeat protein (TIGR01451 family)
VKVNCGWSGTNLVRVRVLGAGVVLLAAACSVLLWSSRPRQSSQNVSSGFGAEVSPINSVVASAQDSNRPAVTSLSQLPLMFEPNVGQTDASVKFVARGAGYSLFLNSEGAILALQHGHDAAHAGNAETIAMKLVGANFGASVRGTETLPGKTNYFLGNDPAKWLHNVSQFSRVRYEDVYPGINLVFYGNQGRLEYDFQVAPGADPGQAELEFDGSNGLELRDGNLILQAQGGSVRLEAPRVYQRFGDREQAVAAHFQIHAANRVGFAIGAYDRSRELIIDPVLAYSTYFGGLGDEHSTSIAVDNTGSVYLTGSTTSSNLPVTTGVFQSTLKGNPNVYVLKVNPQGGANGVVYLTYLGGTGSDTPVGIKVDGNGNAYIVGTTSSLTDFPTTATNAYQAAPKTGSTGTSHVFVTALNSTGSALNYSSYLSGTRTDIASGMTIDNKGDVFVTGTTTSSDTGTSNDQFPASALPEGQPFQAFSRAPIQFFVTKVNTAAFGIGSILYSTYFGGGTPSNAIANGGGIAVDSSGNAYFSGTTNFFYTGLSPQTDFPILNAYQPCLDLAPPATVVNPPICTNSAVTATDAFVAKLNLNPNVPPGSQLLWSTYLGGTQNDSSTGIALDAGAANGANVYITGTTNSSDVTTLVFAPYQKCLNNPNNTGACAAATAKTDAYVARFSNPTTGNMSLTYFSYLGGTGNDAGLAITVDTANGAVLTGWTQSTDFPVTAGAIQSALKGTQQNAFLARINTAATSGNGTVGSYATYFGGTGVDKGTSVALDTNLSTYFAGDTTSGEIQTQAPLQANNKGGSDAFAVKLGTAADLAICGKLPSQTNCPDTTVPIVSAGNQVTFTYTVTNKGPDLATNITVTDNLAASGVPVTYISGTATSGSCSQTATGNNVAVCTINSLQAGSTATVTIVVTPTASGNFNGGAVSVSAANNTDPDLTNNTSTVSGQATDFTLSVSPKNQTIAAAGATAIYTVTLAPTLVYGSNISLSASGLPTASGFTFTPSNTVSLPAGPSTATLNITTTARPVTVVHSRTSRGAIYALWLGIPGITLLGFGVGNDRRRKMAGAAVLCVLFGLLALQPACGGTKTPAVVSGTPAGTYTITVTATSGTLSHNTTLTLTVP